MSQSCDFSYCLLGAQFMRRQIKQLAEQLDGVRRAEDAECVHRARVASRRLRVALRMFRDCWPRDKTRRWKRQISRITRKLGDARDRDVQIEYLCCTLGATAEASLAPGIARLLCRLETEREEFQPRTLKAVARLESSGVLEEMLWAARKLRRDSQAKAAGFSDFTRQQTQRIILKRLEELLRDQNRLADPHDAAGHHLLRIAAKRLRYTLEIAEPVYAGRLGPILDAVKKVQFLLGEVHDCDVWLENLAAFEDQQQARFASPSRFARLKAGIDYLKNDRSANRSRTFQALVDYWGQLRREEIWEQLTGVLNSALGQPEDGLPKAPAAAAEPKTVAAPPPDFPIAPAKPQWERTQLDLATLPR